MAIQTLNTIKNWFKTTLKPSQQQFWDTWDSFRHKLEKVPVKEVEGIDELLNTKADKSVLNAHITDVNAHASLLELKEDKSQKGIAHGYAPLNGFTKLASQYLDIVNDLVSGGSSSLLSAEQGVLLQNQIKNINASLASDNLNLNTFQEIVDAVESIQTSLSNILVNDLTTGGTMKALTAEMGKILNENKENKSQRGIANGYAPLDSFAKISNTYLNIVNDLITGGTDSLLSAEQGKILKEKIDGINTVLSSDNINLDTVQEIVDAIETIQTSLNTILVNDLTTGGTTKALSAEMGKTLKSLIDSLPTPEIPTLQKMVENGGTIAYLPTNAECMVSIFGNAHPTVNFTVNDIEASPTYQSKFYAMPSSTEITHTFYGDTETGFSQTDIVLTEGKVQISENSVSGYSILSFETPIAKGEGATIKIPAKPVGEYKLATTDDFKTINGQSIIGTGDISSAPTLQQVMDAGSAALINGEAGILSNSNNGYSRFYLSGEMLELNNVDTDLKKAISISMKDGGLKITNQNTATGKYTMINSSANPIVNTEIFFPNKETAGNYILATTSDFKTINGKSIVGEGDISTSDNNALHKTGNESKEGDLNIIGNLTVSEYLGITGSIEITDLDTFPRPPETNIILDKNGDLTAKNFIGQSITSYTGEFYSNVKIGTSASNENKLEVNGTISSNGIKIGVANTESSDTIFANTPVGSQKTISGNSIQIAGATGDYFLETFRYNASDYGMQRITFTSTASAGRFFIRTLTAGAWSAWIEK